MAAPAATPPPTARTLFQFVEGDGATSQEAMWSVAADSPMIMYSCTTPEVRGEESDANCDLNTCGGYDSGTCEGGSSTTASEVSEREAMRRGGHRRGRRAGRTTASMRRARAATERVAEAAAASDDDE